MSTAPTIRFLRDRKGASVAYAVHGEGPLVVCPTWWVSHVEKDWEHPTFRAFFERLGRGLTVVRYDRPGVGLSDRTATTRTIDDEIDLLDDVVGAMAQPDHSLFAMSFGGPIAIHHAVRHPDRVRRICFYGAFLDGAHLSPAHVQEAFVTMVRAHWGVGSRALSDILFPDEPRETVDAAARQMRDAASPDVAATLLQQTFTLRSADAARNVAAECLVIHRAGDRAVPFEAGRTLASTLPGARLNVVQGSAHPPWFGDVSLADMANAFLRRDAAGTTAVPVQSAAPASCHIDHGNRALSIEGKTVALTPLEYGVATELVRRANSVVTRDDLLAAVWKLPHEGSNRIDVVVSALRRKLGAWSASIETVTGHGYRFTAWRRKP